MPCRLPSTAPKVSRKQPIDRKQPKVNQIQILLKDNCWSRRLRQPLEDAVPAKLAPVAVRARKPLPALQLMGTILESGRSVAILSLPGGKTELVAEGESVAGFEIAVVAIAADQVTLLHEGEKTNLQLVVGKGN
jgi:type II secretory pathway component PulC